MAARAVIPGLMWATKPKPQAFVGVVCATKMQKTVSVRVDYMYRSLKYKTVIRRCSKIHAHDEASEARVGDRVEITTCRPRSKTKRHVLTKIFARAPVLYPETQAIIAERKANGQVMGTPLGANATAKVKRVLGVKGAFKMKKAKHVTGPGKKSTRVRFGAPPPKS